MPYALILQAQTILKPLFHINGAQLQAAFLGLINQLDPDLSQHLHDGNSLRPYALSLLQRQSSSAKPLQQIRLRVACLDDRIYPVLLKTALRGVGEAKINIAQSEFQITDMLVTSNHKPSWTGYNSNQELIEKAQQACENPFIEFEFATPTVFSQGPRGDSPMPLPEYVFGGLMRRWNNSPNVPIKLPEGFPVQVRDNLTISSFRGETVTLDIGDRLKKTGFVGQITYRIHKPELAFYCHLLAEAAFFSGLGAKTSRGLGCVRKIN